MGKQNVDRVVAAFGSVLFLLLLGSGVFDRFELTAYDIGLRQAQTVPDERVAVLAIDERALANLGRWPWPRDTLAQIVDKLGDARAVGLSVFLVEPDNDPGLLVLEQLRQQLATSQADDALASDAKAQLSALAGQIESAVAALDRDAKLAASLQSNANVVLPIPVEIGLPRQRVDAPLPRFMDTSLITQYADGLSRPLPVRDLLTPLAGLAEYASAIGHLSATLDDDGVVRSEPLILNRDGQLVPAMSLMLAAQGMNLGSEDIRLEAEVGLRIGPRRIDTDARLRMRPIYAKHIDGKPPFLVDSVFDLLNGSINPARYTGKIVLIGPTATGIGGMQHTPLSPLTAPVIKLAHTVSSLLNNDVITQPAWTSWARLAAIALGIIYLVFVLPHLSALRGAFATAFLVASMIGLNVAFIAVSHVWVALIAPAMLLVIGHLILTTRRFFAVERRQQHTEVASRESNRMLALSFQERGQLDQAFETFKRCPMDEDIAGGLYALALDFERKRQFNKAGNVFDHIADYDPTYRDVSNRRMTMREMENTVILAGRSGPGASMVLDADGRVSKPTLGRYTIDKEIGKGAMGIVYLGHDPNIGRVVAIKTLDLANEVDGEERDEILERFFREAKAAGRLKHPNIVTIYDAGEEHDLAYIAMEVLTGRALNHYGKPANLLPADAVLNLIAQCADALHYAHTQHVIHRDIKPGNIMYEPQSGLVKITDFGIARMVDASRTKTGTVMGTPSYMSPEQLAGSHVDGRSDLFSLGVTMFLLLTGRWPFRAESLTNLMYNITNEPHPDISELGFELPATDAIKAVIDRALAKDPDDRFANGAEFAAAVRVCLDQMPAFDVPAGDLSQAVS